MRKFAIPYNNRDVDAYLAMVQKYHDSIDCIYFQFPGLDGHARLNVIESNPLQSRRQTMAFLEKSKGKFRRNLLLNRAFIGMSDSDKVLYIYNTVLPVIMHYGIEEATVSDYSFCSLLHKALPDLQVTLSCNAFCFIQRSIDYWRDVGITTINLPREALRFPQLLKLHGLRIKCIVNEGCLFGCPQALNHACYLASNTDGIHYCCGQGKPSDILRTNFVLPRWLSRFDSIVDSYKIVHRLYSTETLDTILDAYVNERNDVMLSAIVKSRLMDSRNMDLPVKYISDKLLTCECRDCDTCKICDSLFEKHGCSLT